MAMGQQKDRQGDLMVGWAEMPRSPGHVFYDRLQSVADRGRLRRLCRGELAALLRGQDGRALGAARALCSRMHLVGYFEGSDSERGLERRNTDSPVAATVPATGEP